MSFLKTAFFVKNVPPAERLVRLLIAAGIAAWGVVAGGPMTFVLVASAVGLAISGLIGFCPMCALAGRKLKPKH